MKFSIIIPVYNAEKYLRQCLDSVLAQTCTDWECVCIDDGSKDGSGAILDEYASRDARFKVIHQVNQGVAATRNTGLDYAKGDWITWLDADDLYAPWRLAVAETMIESENPDLIHLHFLSGNDAEGVFKEYHPDYSYDLYERAQDIFRLGWEKMNFRGMVWLWFARRDILCGLRFRKGMRIKEDGVFTLGLVPRLRRVCKGSDRGLFYRQSCDSAMHSRRRAEDSVCYLQEMRALWLQQKDYAESIGMLELLKWRIQRGAGTEVIDWILTHSGEDATDARSVHDAYAVLSESGAFTEQFVQDSRYRVTFGWYERFGWQMPLKTVACAVGFLGRIKRMFCK